MPTIAEKARAEADAAEAEEQTEEPAEEPAEEPPHDPAEGLEEPTELMTNELLAACNDHHDHVRSIMGGFVEGWQPCYHCQGIGLNLPEPAPPSLELAPGLAVCTVCKGPGDLATPSTRSGFDVIQCTNCGGRGYVGNIVGSTAAVEQAVATFPQPADGQQLEQQPAPQAEQTDPFVMEAERRGYMVLRKPGA